MCAGWGAFYPSTMSWGEVAEPRSERRALHPRRRSRDGQLLGLLLLGFGVAALLRETGAVRLKWDAILAGLLILLGTGLVLTARSGRRVWPIALGVVLILSLSAHSPSLHFPMRADSGLGDRTVVVESTSQLEQSYSQGVGDLTLDLSHLVLNPETTRLSINDGVGHVKVVVPEGTEVELDASVGVGHAVVLGRGLGRGLGVHTEYRSPGYSAIDHPKVSIEVHVGVGRVEVEVPRAGP